MSYPFCDDSIFITSLIFEDVYRFGSKCDSSTCEAPFTDLKFSIENSFIFSNCIILIRMEFLFFLNRELLRKKNLQTLSRTLALEVSRSVRNHGSPDELPDGESDIQ